jgi:hypothetical protein
MVDIASILNIIKYLPSYQLIKWPFENVMTSGRKYDQWISRGQLSTCTKFHHSNAKNKYFNHGTQGMMEFWEAIFSIYYEH